ncbi:hypothetical protein CEXT_124391 [Caerostris extrusa]|uniref:Uncharacterized protein n=1 Tax=Caerostris extrusa TaxID=172846 RepID=A0AAV4RS56_CAEEX|nr:hypothetical protein CEXT_124391 [Caerostris extrusa]
MTCGDLENATDHNHSHLNSAQPCHSQTSQWLSVGPAFRHRFRSIWCSADVARIHFKPNVPLRAQDDVEFIVRACICKVT